MEIKPLLIIDGGYLVTLASMQIATWSKVREIKLLLGDLVGQLTSEFSSAEIVVALDSKLDFGYYTALRATNYKAGRKPNPLRKKAAKVLASMSNTWGLPGLEADQIAGILVKYAVGLRPVYLLTVDTDWYQLQDDSSGVVVVDLYRSRYLKHHTNETVMAYYQSKVPKRSDFLLQSPRDICRFKQLFGDKSDSLSPGEHTLCYTL
jgi:hypothetical protein